MMWKRVGGEFFPFLGTRRHTPKKMRIRILNLVQQQVFAPSRTWEILQTSSDGDAHSETYLPLIPLVCHNLGLVT